MDYIVVFGQEIPIYGLLGVIGFALGILYLLFACRYTKKSFNDEFLVLIWGAILAMVGAKLLYLLVEIGNFVEDIKAFPNQTWEIIKIYISGGFVFYGGLLGGLLGIYLASKFFKYNVEEQMNRLIPVMAVVHGFGRLGCHVVGCCYGCEYDGPIAIHYTASNTAPNGVGLFPVQFIESMCEFALFVFFLVAVILKARKLQDRFIYIYLYAYSVIRFVLEFFRGDTYRGFLFGVSTSQWISIGIWICTSYVLIRKKFLTFQK